MSRISKKKMMKILKGEYEEPTWNQKTLSEFLARPMTQEQWLRGYREWKKKMRDNDC
tara:strand:+ start:410 stop:580 length:171 start_codon:yes stop_codon:yes gene_type:complete